MVLGNGLRDGRGSETLNPLEGGLMDGSGGLQEPWDSESAGFGEIDLVRDEGIAGR